MAKVLIIGAGGVGQVVTHKCAQVPEVFAEIVLASRTLEKCQRIAAQLNRPIETAQVDADDRSAMTALIERVRPDLVINVALPYQDLPIMDACLATGVHYLDTANYEPPEEAKFEYSWQWAYQDRFRERGLMALLGSGFDPGVTNVYTAYIRKHFLDEIHELDIIDCNAGDHGQPFATNFNPEINIREVTAAGRYWQAGGWRTTPPLSLNREFDFPEGIGPRKIYLMYHEELESLVRHFPEIRRAPTRSSPSSSSRPCSPIRPVWGPSPRAAPASAASRAACGKGRKGRCTSTISATTRPATARSSPRPSPTPPASPP